VLKSGFLQPRKAPETVGIYSRTQRHIFFQGGQERCTFEIRDNGHACRGCLLISETSCEQHNVFLDRSLALETVGYSGSEFFRIHDLPLHSLTDGSLRAVAASLRSGVLAAGMSRSEIQRTCGDASGDVYEYFSTLYTDGFSPKHILAVVQAVLDLRTSVEPLSHILELIVSGPEVPVVAGYSERKSSSPLAREWTQSPNCG
jgi:hypothetical protein